MAVAQVWLMQVSQTPATPGRFGYECSACIVVVLGAEAASGDGSPADPGNRDRVSGAIMSTSGSRHGAALPEA